MASSLLPAPSFASQYTVGEESPRISEKGRDSSEVPTALVGKYEFVGAVPTRILKPSLPESAFTCYAFCAKGDRFVTGEANGTLRLWKTSNYELVGTFSAENNTAIAAVSFFGDSSADVVAVGERGSILLIKFEPEGTSVTLFCGG